MSAHAAFARMLAARLATLVLTVAAFAALGRLLTPEAFGRFALAAAVFALAQTVSEFGLRHYLVRERDLAPETAGRAVGLALVLAAACAAILAALALTLGGGPMHPATAAALLVLAPALLFSAVGTVAEALLQREMDFRLIAWVEVGRAGMDGAVAVALAWAGLGAAALAGGVLASRAASAVAVAALGGHARALAPRLGGWGRFGGFGWRFVATDLLPNAGGLALNATLTAAQGAATLGLYNRAQAIRAMLDRTALSGIRPVVLPVMARAMAAGWSPADIHSRKVDYLCAVCWPAFAFIALLADPIVAVLLGAQWEGAVPAVRILAATGLAVPLTKMSLKFFVATDLLGVYLRVAASQQVIQIALAGAGALVSLEAFCAGIALAAAIRALRLMGIVRARFGPGRPGYGAIAARGGAVTAGALAGPAAILLWAPGPAVALAAALPLAVLGWLAALALTRHRLLAEIGTALRPLAARIGRARAQASARRS